MNEYLSVYDVTITTRAPLFIGSGKSYSKKEYVYDPKSHIVRVMDERKMLDALVNLELVDAYEHYMLHRPYTQLWEFLKECRFSREELDSMTLYTTNAADALVLGKSLAEIWQFIRDVHQRPYVPGSSLKGALRTAILVKILLQEGKTPLIDKSKGRDIESVYLNRLQFKNMKNSSEINSVMRCVSVSDSLPLAQEDIILARKDDIHVSGFKKSINTIREAVRPGVKISFKLTIDSSVKDSINEEFIYNAVTEYSEYYFKTYLSSFRLPDNSVKENFTDCIVLGGGSGYFSKNIVYPILGKEAGVKYVANIMEKKFRKHRHEDDVEKGISPHCLKHTTYNTYSFHFGVCGFKMEQKA